MIRILFLVIASLGLLAALGTVVARNLVHAALFLVAFFFLITCQFVLLEVDFLAAIQVLVYIGAVAVLLLFGIMLTRNIQGDETARGGPLGYLAAAVLTLGLLGMLIVGINREAGLGDRPGWTSIAARPPLDAPGATNSAEPASDPRAVALNNVAGTVGVEMMTRYVIAFEAAGLLLTAAVVGAIALAIGSREQPLPATPSEQTAPGSPPGDGGQPAGSWSEPASEPRPTTATEAPR